MRIKQILFLVVIALPTITWGGAGSIVSSVYSTSDNKLAEVYFDRIQSHMHEKFGVKPFYEEASYLFNKTYSDLRDYDLFLALIKNRSQYLNEFDNDDLAYAIAIELRRIDHLLIETSLSKYYINSINIKGNYSKQRKLKELYGKKDIAITFKQKRVLEEVYKKLHLDLEGVEHRLNECGNTVTCGAIIIGDFVTASHLMDRPEIRNISIESLRHFDEDFAQVYQNDIDQNRSHFLSNDLTQMQRGYLDQLGQSYSANPFGTYTNDVNQVFEGGFAGEGSSWEDSRNNSARNYQFRNMLGDISRSFPGAINNPHAQAGQNGPSWNQGGGSRVQRQEYTPTEQAEREWDTMSAVTTILGGTANGAILGFATSRKQIGLIAGAIIGFGASVAEVVGVSHVKNAYIENRSENVSNITNDSIETSPDGGKDSNSSSAGEVNNNSNETNNSKDSDDKSNSDTNIDQDTKEPSKNENTPSKDNEDEDDDTIIKDDNILTVNPDLDEINGRYNLWDKQRAYEYYEKKMQLEIDSVTNPGDPTVAYCADAENDFLMRSFGTTDRNVIDSLVGDDDLSYHPEDLPYIYYDQTRE